MAKMHDTPMLDELTKGPWPSFVTDIKKAAEAGNEACADLLGQLELSYKDKEGHWKHGGIVGVLGYGGGVIGRYSDVPDLFPGVEHFHTLRVNQPASKFYKTEKLREVMDIWNQRGSGMLNMHGSTGDMVLLGAFTEELEPIFAELTQKGWDLGGSGSALRTPACCVGKARCEFACIDTQDICYSLTQEYQDEMHRPAWPYKFKFKIDGCPNCCVASLARSDCAIIGTWRDDIRIDQEAVAAYVGGEIVAHGGANGADAKLDIKADVIDLCPTGCMFYEDGKLSINNAECTRCMHCINVMPRALRPGLDTGASILVGAKAPILEGAQMGSLIIPFIKMEEPYDEFNEFVEKMWDWWDENGKNRERIGELIQRVGLSTFITAVDLKPIPQMVKEPRSNPYIFYKEDEVPGGFERDISDYRKKHAR
ncbi:MAG: dissimilatory-type sulfite reductase subunit alpha [Desulfarculaceae bacterium]|nr:dissimilatory-type sulfite reductase subunit alpha [Desulfarculaceae bacterium]MCF8048727.1 dissimilatory-type sulfite reductase subunit alpha [Desulfarculaceae bacterium]MCF8066585.1 dissimilatory-type sulfite reductase subunit alpha [Desulfarculaceae bacterium]MCF8122016.1 dissimilatory-type sulfite reductase subunit alpha [Desulfarculaceae bacterium]